jgi:2-polyprenyl-6-hydroxyphenyl methylase/3-demethylubiquinone-9 3-methyltransferase
MNKEISLNEHFEFGKNWEVYLKGISEEKLYSAIYDLKDFLGHDMLGRSFIDIGCGSGLSSLAAYKLGADKIFSYDIDPINIRNVEFLKHRFTVPPEYPWVAETCSIVDTKDLSRIAQGDIVYSWGVLHHTGDMWQALRNTASLVKDEGILYLMLYRDAKLAYIWKLIKKSYVRAPVWLKFLIRNLFAGLLIAGMVLKGKNPVKSIKSYGKRGMSWYTDVIDWVGGYPFEYAEAEQVIEFLDSLGFSLSRIRPEITKMTWGLWGTGSYQYIFKKGSSQ